MKYAFPLCAIVLSLSGFGCVAATSQVAPPDPHKQVEPPKENVPPAEKARGEALFKQALSEMARLDKAGAWTKDTCGHVAKGFLEAADAPGKEHDVEAIFNAGVAFERCEQNEEARAQFERAVALQGDFHPAKVHLILLHHRESGGKDIDQSITALRRAAVVDARYGNVEALVALAMLSLQRGNDSADTDGVSDRARAIRYLQSALAVDDGYLPAMNGLALYYLGEARIAGGQKASRSITPGAGLGQVRGTQAMELAALVCAQAIRKDPNDPVIHNTYGLIQVELGNLGKAAEAFGKARALRPGFYEAEMNFAAVNLQFRGFGKAEEAYRAVLKDRTNDYDARLGLALSLRGQIQDQNADAMVKEAEKELAKAKEIAPDRPEAYYNEAILTQEYKARGAGAGTEKELKQAQELFRKFVGKAGAAAEYATAVKLAGERIKEIDEVIKFLGESTKEPAKNNGS